MRIWFLIPGFLFSLLTFSQTSVEIYREAIEYIKQNDFEKAIVYLDKALGYDSANADHYNLKGHCLSQLKRNKEAFSVYSEGIKRNPDNPFLYYSRGYFLLFDEEYKQAIVDFTKCLELPGNDSLIKYSYSYRGEAKLRIRDFTGSYDDLMKAYNLDSNNIITLTFLGSVCDDLGKMDDAMKYLSRVIQIAPDYIPAIANMGFKYQQLGQHEKAIGYYDRVIAMEPGVFYGYSNRSYSRYKLGDLKGAMVDINRSLDIHPGNSYAYRVRALIYIELKDIDKACADLKTAADKGFAISYGDEVVNLQKKYCKIK